MCLLVLAWRTHPRYRLVVAANRDEFHERPRRALATWPPPQEILAGRDLRAEGTWLALDRGRRFGVVTNYRELQRPRAGAPSRGGLIPEYLATDASAEAFFGALSGHAAEYSGFNLLLADAHARCGTAPTAPPLSPASCRPGYTGFPTSRSTPPGRNCTRVRAGLCRRWLRVRRPPGRERCSPARRPHPRGRCHPAATAGLPQEWERALVRALRTAIRATARAARACCCWKTAAAVTWRSGASMRKGPGGRN